MHFETEEVARTAIEKVNGMLLNGKKVLDNFIVFIGNIDGVDCRLV